MTRLTIVTSSFVRKRCKITLVAMLVQKADFIRYKVEVAVQSDKFATKNKV